MRGLKFTAVISHKKQEGKENNSKSVVLTESLQLASSWDST